MRDRINRYLRTQFHQRDREHLRRPVPGDHRDATDRLAEKLLEIPQPRRNRRFPYPLNYWKS
jgi:hypothetical protein